jgi:undecaprenyl diphosphate synthase
MKRMSQQTTASIPVHLGLILDGNRRWAHAQSLPTLDGHRKGYENLKSIVKLAFDSGIKFVSAYVFSTENWGRSKEEINYLMNLLLWVAKNEIGEFDKDNIRVRFIGEESHLSDKVLRAMRKAEEKTKGNTGGTLLLCMNYGGQQEIADAVTKMLAELPNLKKVTPDNIAAYLHEPNVPAVDLIIRTSGEQRISNFMLWRAAYSELYFTDVQWPAFNEDNFKLALDHYASRQRRFGK